MNTFKRTLAILLSVVMLLSAFSVATFSVSADTEDMIYFVPSSNWKNDGARFAVHPYHSTEGFAWESMTDEDGDGIYEAVLPEGNWTNVIFCRMNPETPENTWDNKWNQSADFTLDGTNNCLTLNENEWDDAQGTWSVHTVEKPTDTPTEAPSEAPIEDGKVIVKTSINGTDLSEAKKDTADVDTITVAFRLQADLGLTNCQGELKYNSDALELLTFTMPNIAGPVINTNLYNTVKFNASTVQAYYDFTTSKDFCIATFKAKKDCNTVVALDFEELNAVKPIEDNKIEDVALVTDGKVVGTFKSDAEIVITEIEKPTESTAKPTQPATKAPSVKLNKSSIKSGAKTKVVVSDLNGKKVQSYKSSNVKVAKVDSKGNITALNKGTVKITVKISGKNYSKTLKVSSAPTIKYKNKTYKSGKTITIKKGKTVTLKITGKASAIKNKVTIKSKKIAKIKSKATQTKVVFKAMKKGRTTLTVKINGVKTFKYTIKVK